MNFIELHGLDGKSYYINPAHVTLVTGYGESGTYVRFVDGHEFHSRQTPDAVMQALQGPLI